jgi:photosystem II stability/assembly factor-like uncharacterized protein
MKELFYKVVVIILFVLCGSGLYAQTGWYSVHSDTTDMFLSIPDINTIYGTGNYGNNIWVIKKSTDGGITWSFITPAISGTQVGSGSIYFINSSTGFVSLSGHCLERLIMTTNGGQSWVTKVDTNVIGYNDIIHSISFPSANIGYASGRSIWLLKTTNGGINWTKRTDMNGVGDMYFTTIDTGFYDANYDTRRTINGGTNWTMIDSTNGMKSASFLNSIIGYKISNELSGVLSKTTNSGTRWNVIATNIALGIQFTNSVFFYNETTGWIAGANTSTNYRNRIKKSTNGGLNWINQSIDTTVNGIIYSVKMFDANTGYAYGNSSYSTYYKGTLYKTTTGGAVFVSAPTLSSPTNNAVNISITPTLIWNSLYGSTKYRIQVSTDQTFTTASIDTTVTNVTQLMVPSGRLNGISVYYWRVYGTNDYEISPWSSVWNFTTTLATPSLISPANGVSSVTLTPLIDWSDITGATTYNVQVATNSSFTTPVIDLSSLSSSQYQVASGFLQANTLYYWRASASNSNGTSNWATEWNFTTLAAPNTPNLISPTNGSNILTTTPTLDWSDVTGAISYTVQAATDTNFINLVINQSGLTVSQYNIPSSTLTGNTIYYWRARAVNGAGTGPWSVRWNFRVVITPSAPNLVTPLNNSTNQPATVFLDWDSLAAANTYRIQLATDSLFNSIVFDTSSVSRSYLQMRPSILLANVKYYWRVNATNLAGTGSWSVIWNFRINPTGIYQYSSEVPKEFKLHNNYPNPFNPSTKIRFDNPKYSDVKISVYDISGRLINQIVNEKLNAGSYELTWNANNYASGVYFYRIEAGSFTDVKRMLLVK